MVQVLEVQIMGMRNTKAKVLVSMLVLAGILGFSIVVIGGSLEPSAPPGPTMKTLAEIEPGTPISSVPYTIAESGSYYLCSNAQTTSSMFHGITIWADNVTLDLKGFALIGEGTAGKHGVVVEGSYKNIKICNGTVRGWGGNGVDLSSAANGQLENLRASDNGGSGLRVGEGSTVKDCAAKSNGNNGIETDSSCTITDCSARYNDAAGFSVGGGGTISNCSASRNTGTGILCREFSCTVTNCTVVANSVNGISVPNGSIVNNCAARGSGATGIDAGWDTTVNGCSAVFNTGDGITATTRCTIKNCTVSVNGSDGIEVEHNCLVLANTCAKNGFNSGDSAGIHVTGSGNRIEGNNITGNDTRGIDVDGTRNIIIKNTATGHYVATISKAYTIVSGNAVGQILSSITTGHITSCNPWANFYFSE